MDPRLTVRPQRAECGLTEVPFAVYPPELVTPASPLADPSVAASAEAPPESAGSRSYGINAGDWLLDDGPDVVAVGLGADCWVAASDDAVAPESSVAGVVGVGVTGGVGVAAAGVDAGAGDSVPGADVSPTDAPAETGPAETPPGWGDPAFDPGFDVADEALGADDCATWPNAGRCPAPVAVWTAAGEAAAAPSC